MQLKDNIKKIRTLRGLSQRELEEKTGIHNRLIQMYESGKRIPKEENLQKIAHALGVDIYALKEIDINPDNQESVRQLLFQLEAKGLFSIDNITPEMTYIDGKPQWTLSLPVDGDTARFCRTWTKLKKGPLPKKPSAYQAMAAQTTGNSLNNTNKQHELEKWPKIDLEHWKYDKSAQDELDAPTENLDLKSTAQLANCDLLTSEEAINRLRKGYYSFDDLELILQRLGATTDCPSKQIENLTLRRR